MPLSYTQSYGDGVTRQFAVPFPYISRAHIGVTVNGTPVPFNWLNPQLIETHAAPPPQSVVERRRTTPRERVLVDFVDGSTLTESDLDTATLQSFYLAQEAFDVAGGTLGINSDGTYSAFNRRISALGDPVADGDAVNKRTFDAGMASVVAQTNGDRAATAADRVAVAGDTALARTAADAAYQWANSPVGQPVKEGEYSAYHWACRAKAIVGGEASGVSYRPNSPIDDTNVQAALDTVAHELRIRYTKSQADAAFVRAGSGFSCNGGIASQNYELWDHNNRGGHFRLCRYDNKLRLRNEKNEDLVVIQTDGNIFAPVWNGGHLGEHIHRSSNNARQNAQDWAYGNLIQDIRLNGWWEAGRSMNAWAHCPNGGVVTAWYTRISHGTVVPVIDVMGGRFLQAQRGGQWFTWGVWG